MMAEAQPAVVIDNGSSHLTAGFAGDDSPKCRFPMLVGKMKFPMVSLAYIQVQNSISYTCTCIMMKATEWISLRGSLLFRNLET